MQACTGFAHGGEEFGQRHTGTPEPSEHDSPARAFHAQFDPASAERPEDEEISLRFSCGR